MLSDGSPFSIRGENIDSSVNLEVTSLPAVTPGTINLNDPGNMLLNARDGLTINLTDGFTYSPIRIGTGGVVNASNMRVYADAQVIDGEFHLSGQSVGDYTGYVQAIHAEGGSLVTVSAGRVEGIYANAGSVVTISGGKVDGVRASEAGASLTMTGGLFRKNGSLLPGFGTEGASLQIDLIEGDVLTGELSDGTPFMLYGGDSLANGVLHLQQQTPPALSQATFNLPVDTAPSVLREGQSLTLDSGGVLGDDVRVGYGASLTVNDGVVGYSLKALAGSQVRIHGGTIRNLSAAAQSDVVIDGGNFTSILNIEAGATASTANATYSSSTFVYGNFEIQSGVFTRSISAYDGSQLTVKNGDFDSIRARDGSDVEISGGKINGQVYALEGAVVTLIGDSFIVDGIDITSLLSDSTPYIVSERDILFEGTLANGDTFSTTLVSSYSSTNWYFSTNLSVNPTLQLLLPSVTSGIPGDYDGNGMVNELDYQEFVNQFGQMGPNLSADGNGNGTVDAADYTVWRDHYSASLSTASTVAIPEPTACLLGLIACVGLLHRTNRSR